MRTAFRRTARKVTNTTAAVDLLAAERWPVGWRNADQRADGRCLHGRRHRADQQFTTDVRRATRTRVWTRRTSRTRSRRSARRSAPSGMIVTGIFADRPAGRGKGRHDGAAAQDRSSTSSSRQAGHAVRYGLGRDVPDQAPFRHGNDGSRRRSRTSWARRVRATTATLGYVRPRRNPGHAGRIRTSRRRRTPQGFALCWEANIISFKYVDTVPASPTFWVRPTSTPSRRGSRMAGRD